MLHLAPAPTDAVPAVAAAAGADNVYIVRQITLQLFLNYAERLQIAGN